MPDDDFVEGDSSSAAADVPGAVPADDDAPARGDKRGNEGFDSTAVHDAPVVRRSAKTQHTVEARRAFAAAVLANKAKPAAAAPAAAVDDLDPEAPEPIAAKADVAAAKQAGADAPRVAPTAADILAAPPPAAPPAPSLDPEVRRLKDQLAADRKALETERAELDKRKATPVETPPDAMNLEDYIDHAPRSFRNWLESMHGAKMTDEDFKAEISDFITQASADVLGVPLPEATRTRLESALARKAVKTSRTLQTRRETVAAEKQAKERAAAEEKAAADDLERQWTEAARGIGGMFAPTQDAAGTASPSVAAKTYPWLAAEDEPGKIIVDVIRAAAVRDGTQMSWQDASKKANDYLEAQAKTYYEKRKPLLGERAAAPVAAAAPKLAAPAAPAPPAPPAPPVTGKWTRDKHLESTKAAFRAKLAGQ